MHEKKHIYRVRNGFKVQQYIWVLLKVRYDLRLLRWKILVHQNVKMCTNEQSHQTQKDLTRKREREKPRERNILLFIIAGEASNCKCRDFLENAKILAMIKFSLWT